MLPEEGWFFQNLSNHVGSALFPSILQYFQMHMIYKRLPNLHLNIEPLSRGLCKKNNPGRWPWAYIE